MKCTLLFLLLQCLSRADPEMGGGGPGGPDPTFCGPQFIFEETLKIAEWKVKKVKSYSLKGFFYQKNQHCVYMNL
jgi:hypothetical protein